MRILLLLLMLLLFSAVATLNHAQNSSGTVTVINDLGDGVQHLEWFQDMNLLDVMYKRAKHNVFDHRLYLLSAGNMKRFSKPDSTMLAGIKVSQGDLIIIGGLDTNRETRVRQNQEVDAAFKAVEAINQH